MRIRILHRALFFIAIGNLAAFAQCNDRTRVCTVDSTTLTPLTPVGAGLVQIRYLNRFRFDYNPTSTVTVISAPSQPTLLVAGTNSVPAQTQPDTSAPVKPAVTTAQVQKVTTDKSSVVSSSGKQTLAKMLNDSRGLMTFSADDMARAGVPNTDILKLLPNSVTVVAPVPDTVCVPGSSQNIWDSPATDPATQKTQINHCWNLIQTKALDSSNAVTGLTEAINKAVRTASAEQGCYTEKLGIFSAYLLTYAQASALFDFAGANKTAGAPGGCYRAGGDTWSPPDIDQVEKALVNEQNGLTKLATAPGYSDWLGAASTPTATAAKALSDAVTSLLATVRSYQTGTPATGANALVTQSFADFAKVVASNQQWRDRLHIIFLAGTPGTPQPPSTGVAVVPENTAFTLTVTPKPCKDWYGRGSTEAITFKYTDLTGSAGSGTPQVLTNTCNPLSILSTGVGVTFLANPTYGFVSDPAGTQVIGITASNKVQPLYGLLYNVLLKPLGKGTELFASPGVGLTTSSSTTTTDFIGGLSLGLGRRLFFITASADIGQRTRLLPGFAVGSPKSVTTSSGTSTLATVPTQSYWSGGAMITVSFGIAPK